MSWSVIIIIVVLVCICIAIAESNETQANTSNAALAQQRQDNLAQQRRLEKERDDQYAARRPEALAQLLREEFPQFRQVFTYGRCQQLLTWHEDRGADAARKARFREPARADRLLGMLFSREIAPIFLADFTAFSSSEPEQVWRTVEMCIGASAVRAQA